MKDNKVTVIDENGVLKFQYPEDVQMVIVCGDIHGAFREIVNKVACQYRIENALVVIAGDCGFGFEREGYYENIYQRVSKHLKRNNLYFAFVRGNHDNPFYFSAMLIGKQRWMTVPDYSVIYAAGKQVLCVGGAVSVDRTWRMQQKPLSSSLHYNGREETCPAILWMNDKPVYNEERLEAINRECRIDTVVTHTAPSFCEFISKDGLKKFAADDPTLMDDVTEERALMDRLHDSLRDVGHPLKDWTYGHFHSSWHQNINNVMFSMLDCEELKELH